MPEEDEGVLLERPSRGTRSGNVRLPRNENKRRRGRLPMY